ncbi:MAG: sugar phosphate isomerase/epimerase [Chloroflexi bacterium]|nr:sugar phosphate isomerase/epimerase [Chloroflexota bacterium]
MRASITAWNVQAPSLEHKMQAFAALGFDGVAFLHRVPAVSTDGQGDRLGELLFTWGLEALVHGAVGNAGRGIRAVREHIEAVARFQAETGRVWAMTFDPGYRRQGRNAVLYDADRTARVLELALRRLAPLGVRVGLENWTINTSVGCFERLAERLGDPALGVLLDLGHLHIACCSGLLEDTPEQYIRALPLPIWELHVHDNNGLKDQHRPLGRGTLDVERMAGVLAACGFNGYVTVEVILMDTRRPTCRDAMRRTRDQTLRALAEALAPSANET